jgi:hypothetical protein
MKTLLIASFCFLLSANIQAQSPNVTNKEAAFERMIADAIDRSRDADRQSHDDEATSKRRHSHRTNTLIKGEWSNVFGYSNSIDGGAIYAMAEVGDSLFIGGDFSDFMGTPAYHVVLYNTATKEVTDLDDGTTNVVRALAFHDGKLYAGGGFYFAGALDVEVNGLAVYEDGKWSAIGGDPNGDIDALAIYKGRLIAGGDFTSIDGQELAGIAVFDGSSWSPLGEGVRLSNNQAGSVSTLLVKGDSLFVGGYFTRLNGERSDCVGLWTDENEWEPIDLGVGGGVGSLEWFEEKLWIGGDFVFGSTGGVMSPFLITWDGSEFIPVGTGADRFVSDLFVVGDTLYAAGSFLTIDGVKVNGIGRYTNGAWSAVGQGTFGPVEQISRIGNDIYIAGNFTRAGGLNAQSLAAFGHNSGTWKSGLTRGAAESYAQLRVEALANTEDFLYVGGRFLRAGGKVVNNIAAWNKSTGLWSAMSGGLDGGVRDITVRGTEVFVSGSFNRAGTVEARSIAKWDEATKTWSALGAGSSRNVDAVEVDNENVYASVFFDYADGNYLNNVGKWNGATWEAIPGAFNGFVDELMIEEGKLYIAGSIFDIDGERMNNIAVFESGAWSTLGGGIDGRPSVLVSAHGKLYAAGAIQGNFDQNITGLMQFDGTDWSSVGTGVDDYVYSGYRNRNGVVFGGWFQSAGGKSTIKWLGEWNGSTWTALPEGGVDYVVYAITGDNESMFFGGYLGQAGDVTSWRLAKLDLEQNSVHDAASHEALMSFDPESRKVRLEGDARFTRVIVTDLLGRIVATLEPQYTGEISVAQLPVMSSGVYLIKFVGEKSVTGRIIY